MLLLTTREAGKLLFEQSVAKQPSRSARVYTDKHMPSAHEGSNDTCFIRVVMDGGNFLCKAITVIWMEII